MPLHLLGKKSWNVYNKANIETVRRDEAIAKAAEEAEEERMEALYAERRMQTLRGEIPSPISPADIPTVTKKHRPDRLEHSYREKKTRKKSGENDTDFEIRVARQKADEVAAESDKLSLETPIVSRNSSHVEIFKKNSEAEKEAFQKKKEYEDQYIMRFSNAAGCKQNSGEPPWYLRAELEVSEANNLGSKDIWGNGDSKRSQREGERVLNNDPLLIMKAGAKRVREVEKERKKQREDKKNTERYLRKETKISKRMESFKKDYQDGDLDIDSLDIAKSEQKPNMRNINSRNHRHRHR